MGSKLILRPFAPFCPSHPSHLGGLQRKDRGPCRPWHGPHSDPHTIRRPSMAGG